MEGFCQHWLNDTVLLDSHNRSAAKHAYGTVDKKLGWPCLPKSMLLLLLLLLLSLRRGDALAPKPTSSPAEPVKVQCRQGLTQRHAAPRLLTVLGRNWRKQVPHPLVLRPGGALVGLEEAADRLRHLGQGVTGQLQHVGGLTRPAVGLHGKDECSGSNVGGRKLQKGVVEQGQFL